LPPPSEAPPLQHRKSARLKLRVAFPQPEVRAERLPGAHDSGAEPAVAHEQLYVGMGDLQIDLDELNLCLDW